MYTNNLNVPNEKTFEELGIQFRPQPVDIKTVDVLVNPGPLLKELCQAVVFAWFPVEGSALSFTSEKLEKYVCYLIQERIKQVNRQQYDRSLVIPGNLFAIVGSVYAYRDKKKGVMLVPKQNFASITRDNDIDEVARKLSMAAIPTSTNLPVELEGSSPSALWVMVSSDDRVVALDEVTLTDALFTSIMNRTVADTIYGDYRVAYGDVRSLIPAVYHLAGC